MASTARLSPQRHAAAAETHARPGFTDRAAIGWHLTWLGVLAVVGLVLALTALDDTGGPAALAAVVAMGAAYLLLGWRLVGGRYRDGLAVGYLAGVVVGLLLVQRAGGLQLVTPLLFALFPQLWTLLTRPLAALATAVVPLALGAARATEAGWAGPALVDVAVESVAQLAVALLLGLWITGMTAESASRAEMVQQLQAARADLAAAERARGVLAERERVAREIHDTLAQGFLSTVTLAQAARAALRRDDVALVEERLALLETTARDNLAEARAIVEARRPADLADAPGAPPDDTGGARLPGALRRLAARTEDETGVPVDVVAAHLPPLPPPVEVVLLRAAQEGLSNVRQHAAARHVVLQVEARSVDGAADEVVLWVVDDGRGPGGSRAGSGAGGGYGLHAMASRLREVGGSVTLAPRETGGSVLEVRAPLAREGAT
ncbi:sensor histidine kinase [Pseudokineococcus sp. 1T1Z-3]|uniref:sensor histidine kinase n=1 Tax=Pseudokineococcus sp. 1T1Z-3 TaxID=3132745 RepID=UPI0030B22530